MSIELTQAASVGAENLQTNDFHTFRIAFNSLFLKEDFVSATDLAQNAQANLSLSAPELLELARCFQSLGDSVNTISSIDTALELDPDNHAAIDAKLKVLFTLGNQEAYLKYLKDCLNKFPAEKQYYSLLLEFYQESGLPDLAAEVLNSAELCGINLSESLPALNPDNEPSSASIPDYEDQVLLNSFLNLLAGRENCHARQWVSDKGKNGYTPVLEPLNPSHIRSHLSGLYTLGVYQLNLNNQVKWIAFDLDITSDYLADLSDPQFRAWTDQGFLEVIKNFHSLLATFHLEAAYEFSGYKGYHVWLFLQEAISAGIARTFAQKLAAQLDLSSYPFHLEIFPKQTRVSAGNYGNLIKLPCGIHRVSGLRSTFLTLHDDQLELRPLSHLLQNPPLISAQDFLSALYSLQPDFSINTLKATESPALPVSDLPSPLSTNIDPDTDPQWLWMKQHCSAIALVCQTIEVNRTLSNEQKKVLIYSAGYLPRGSEIVNACLRKCTNCDPADLLKSPLKGNVISCNKIKSYLNSGNSSFECYCDFSSQNASYDNPLLHLGGYADQPYGPQQNNELKLRDAISRYLEAKRKHNELSIGVQALEKQILSLFEDTGVQQFTTTYGVLKRITLDSQTKLILELT